MKILLYFKNKNKEIIQIIIKRYLIFVYVILTGFQLPIWAIPPKDNVVNFINNHFPPRVIPELTRRNLIFNVNDAIYNNFRHMYGENEEIYWIEACLAAFGLAFYTNEEGKTLYAVRDVDRFNKFMRDRISGEIRTSDINQDLCSVFDLVNFVSKDSRNPDSDAIEFYTNLAIYLNRTLKDPSNGYGGSDFFRDKNLTVNFGPMKVSLKIPVLRGVPVPLVLPDSIPGKVNILMERILAIPPQRIETSGKKARVNTSKPIVQNTIDTAPNTLKNNGSGIAPNSVISPLDLKSIKNSLAYFRDTYKNNDGVAGKYDFFSFED